MAPLTALQLSTRRGNWPHGTTQGHQSRPRGAYTAWCRRWGEGRRVGGGGGLVLCVWGRGAVFDWVQHEGATPRAPSDRENAPLAMALAFEAARSASRAICLDWGLCGYVFARSCRAQNTILLASGQKVPILPSSFTKQVWALSIHPTPRPTAGTTRCMHPVSDSDAPGWCREASYRALWTVGGPSAVPQRAC